jgi:hypothetical protein
MKTTGQSNTPAVRLKERFSCPKNERDTGRIPNVFSSEKIFTPINSAITAFETKNIPKKRKRRFFLSFILFTFVEY